jgi:hypothetical protein
VTRTTLLEIAKITQPATEMVRVEAAGMTVEYQACGLCKNKCETKDLLVGLCSTCRSKRVFVYKESKMTHPVGAAK